MSTGIEKDWSWFGESNLSKGRSTELRIIMAAIRLFSVDGFNSVTLQKIASASDTSHPLILKYFGNKEELLFAVRKFVTFSNHQWVDAKITPTMNGREQLLVHCLENIRWGYHKPAEAKIILLTYYYYSSLEGALSKPGIDALKKGEVRILGHVLQAEREGLISSGENVEFIAEVIHEFTIGLFTRMLTFDLSRNKELPPIYKKKLDLFLTLFFKS